MSHAKTTTPEFVLLAQFHDDTLATIAQPTLVEIEEMRDLYRKKFVLLAQFHDDTLQQFGASAKRQRARSRTRHDMNQSRIEQFLSIYEARLAEDMRLRPDSFMQNISAAEIAQKVRRRLEQDELGSIGIRDSASWRSCARHFGLKSNSYVHWQAWFDGGSE